MVRGNKGRGKRWPGGRRKYEYGEENLGGPWTFEGPWDFCKSHGVFLEIPSESEETNTLPCEGRARSVSRRGRGEKRKPKAREKGHGKGREMSAKT